MKTSEVIAIGALGAIGLYLLTRPSSALPTVSSVGGATPPGSPPNSVDRTISASGNALAAIINAFKSLGSSGTAGSTTNTFVNGQTAGCLYLDYDGNCTNDITAAYFYPDGTPISPSGLPVASSLPNVTPGNGSLIDSALTSDSSLGL